MGLAAENVRTKKTSSGRDREKRDREMPGLYSATLKARQHSLHACLLGCDPIQSGRILRTYGAHCSVVVEVLCYESEGRGFETR
jgi:hypothetical protein